MKETKQELNMDEKTKLIAEISRLFTGTVADHEALMGLLSEKGIPELQQIALRLQLLNTERELVKLVLMDNGLANSQTNWFKIDNKLGAYYTPEQFREAITQDPEFKQSLEWKSEPFAAVVHAEQRQKATDQKQFEMFVGCAKAATARGVDVNPCRANYEMVKEAIDEQGQDFNNENCANMLFRGRLPLAPNPEGVAVQMFREREDAERDRLAEIVVDAMQSWRMQGPGGTFVRNDYARNQALAKMKNWPLDELRSRVQVIERNRSMANTNIEDLKDVVRDQTTERREALQAKSGLTLPSHITGTEIKRASSATLREWIRKYGSAQITARLRGESA